MTIRPHPRRQFLKTVGLTCLAAATGGAGAAKEKTVPAKRPNIIVALTDDLGFADLGCFGSPVIRTPHLDKFASEGVKLTQCYAGSSNCSPSRAAMLTGRMPYRVGMYDFRRGTSPMHLPKNETCVAQLLKDAGYETMFVGKWHLGDMGGRFGHPTPGDHGFDYWLANVQNFGPNPKSLVRNGKPAGPLEGVQCTVVIREAISWLQKDWERDKPFCMFVWFNEPHTPVVADEPFKAPYRTAAATAAAEKVKYGGPGVKRVKPDPAERPTYFGCVSQMDHEFGRLMKTVDALGLRDDTFVFFTSDNGPEHRADTSWGSPGDFRGAKGHMHEGGIHVPGIIRWPGKVKAGTISDLPVNGTDVLPTLCALAGTAPKTAKPIDGVNLLPAIVEGKPVERPKPLFWWMFHARGGKQACLRDGHWKILARMTPQSDPPNLLDGARPPARQPSMDFIKETELGGFELFNLREDPNETTDLSASEPERLAAMTKAIVAMHKEVQAEGPVWTSVEGARKRR